MYKDGNGTPLHRQAWSLLVELYLTTYQVEKASAMISDDKLAEQVTTPSVTIICTHIPLIVGWYHLPVAAAPGVCVCVCACVRACVRACVHGGMFICAHTYIVSLYKHNITVLTVLVVY